MAVVDPEMERRQVQFFGFTATQFVDDVVNCIFDYVVDCVDQVERKLIKDLGMERNRLEKKKRIYAGGDSLLKRLEKAVDKNFGRFEAYVVRNVFKIPDELAEAVGPELAPMTVDGQADRSAETKIDRELAALRRQIREQRLRNAALRGELHMLERTRETLDAHSFDFIDGALRENNIEPRDAAKMAKKVTTRMSDLARLVAELKDMEPQLLELAEEIAGEAEDADDEAAGGGVFASDRASVETGGLTDLAAVAATNASQ